MNWKQPLAVDIGKVFVLFHRKRKKKEMFLYTFLIHENKQRILTAKNFVTRKMLVTNRRSKKNEDEKKTTPILLSSAFQWTHCANEMQLIFAAISFNEFLIDAFSSFCQVLLIKITRESYFCLWQNGFIVNISFVSLFYFPIFQFKPNSSWKISFDFKARMPESLSVCVASSFFLLPSSLYRIPSGTKLLNPTKKLLVANESKKAESIFSSNNFQYLPFVYAFTLYKWAFLNVTM